MVDKRNSREESKSGPQLKVTVISWKDERWSADKETLDAINKRLFGKRPRRKYFYETCMGILASVFHPLFRLWLFAVRKGKYYSKIRKRR